MIYHGNNDYRDYLSHHGVLGMHWGIRRYQPYSVKPRGSGKTGKEIGEAKSKKHAAKEYNKQLSKLTRQRDVSKIRLYDATRKSIEKKGKKALSNKSIKADKKVEKYQKQLSDIESDIKRVVSLAQKEGLQVQEYTKTRDLAAGRKALATAIGAVGGFYMGNIVAKLAIASGVKPGASSTKNVTTWESVPIKTFENSVKPIDVKPIETKGIITENIIPERIITENIIKENGDNIPISKSSNNESLFNKGRIAGAVSGALLGRRMYDQAYRAAHKRGSKVTGTRYKVSSDNPQQARDREELEAINPEDIDKYYKKKREGE